MVLESGLVLFITQYIAFPGNSAVFPAFAVPLPSIELDANFKVSSWVERGNLSTL